MGNPVKPPKTSPNQFLGSSMSRLFPEPLNDRMFPAGPAAAALFQDFLLRPPSQQQPPIVPPMFGGPQQQNTSMQDLSQELDTLAITNQEARTQIATPLKQGNTLIIVRMLVGKTFQEISVNIELYSTMFSTPKLLKPVKGKAFL